MSRFLMAGVALVGLSAGFARAELLLDTLTSELDGTVVMSAANDRRSAQSFTTSASTTSRAGRWCARPITRIARLRGKPSPDVLRAWTSSPSTC